MEMRDRARRIRHEVEQRVRQAESMRGGIGRRRGMNEDHRFSTLELVEDGVESLVAEIDAARVREQNDAVQAQHVERVRELGEGPVDVRQRQASERAKARRTRLYQLRGQLVAAASERPCTRVVTRVD